MTTHGVPPAGDGPSSNHDGKGDDGQESGGAAATTGDLPGISLLREMRRRLIDETIAIPRFKLLGDQRMLLASFLFREAVEFTDDIADALKRQPELFSHIGVDGDLVAEKAGRAIELTNLSGLFQSLADWSKDLALCEQVEAIKLGMIVVRQVRGENALPAPPPGAAERKMALIPAERALSKRKGRKIRGAKKAKSAADKFHRALAGAEQSAAAPLASPAPPLASPAPPIASPAPQAAGAASEGKKNRKIVDPFVVRGLDDIMSSWISQPRFDGKAAADHGSDQQHPVGDQQKGAADRAKGAADRAKGAADRPKDAADRPKGAADRSNGAANRPDPAADQPKKRRKRPAS